MSKDTNNHQIPFPFSSFGMGMPFPMYQQPMGQFIPMGMLPMNGTTTQGYMPDISKNSYGPPPQEMFPQFSHIKRNDSSSPVIPGNKEWLKPNDERRHSPDSSVNAEEKSHSNPYESPYIGTMDGSMLPMMPSVVFFPYLGGFPGFLPSGLPPFSPHKINKLSATTTITDKDEDKQTKSENNKEIKKPVEAARPDELDVAQILVDMQGPAKQITDFEPPSEVPVCVKEGSDCTTKDNQNVDITKSEPSETLQKIQNTEQIDNISINDNSSETKSGQNSGRTTPTSIVNVAVPFEVKAEYQSHKDGAKVDQHTNFEAVPKIQIKMEKDEYDEVEADSVSTNDINSVQAEDNSSLSDDVQSDFQQNPANQLHELQVFKREDIEQQQQQQPSYVEVQAQQQNEVIYSNNMEVSSEVSVQSSSVIDAAYPPEQNKEIEQNHTIKEKPATAEQGLLEEEQLNDSGSNLKMTFKCDVCSQLFRSPLGLQKHIEFHTDDGKHYACSICFVQFHNNANLQSHLETHTKKRPHKCTFCPKAFRDPGSLQKHVRVHTGEKPFECKDCDRSFAEYSSLRKHQRVHTGEQPYKCRFCNKAFSISGNLQRHILIHTGERPYKCNFCPKAFNNPSHLRRHVKNLHFKGDSVVDEAMLSHYGNHVNKAGDETTDEVAMEMTAEAMHSNYGSHVSRAGNETDGDITIETTK